MAHTPEEESLPREEDLEELAKEFFKLPPGAIDATDLEEESD